MWSVKLVERFHKQDAPASFYAFIGKTLEAAVQKIPPELLPKGFHLQSIDQEKSFMQILTEPISVDQPIESDEPETLSCWIDASRDNSKAASSYFVSCGIRYTTEEDAALKLFEAEYSPIPQRLIWAPSKALVFSDIHQCGVQDDAARVLDTAKSMRNFNPFATKFDLTDDVGTWASAWWDDLTRSPTKSDLNADDREAIRVWVFRFANKLEDVPAKKIMELSAMLCSKMVRVYPGNNDVSLPFGVDAFCGLVRDQQLALTGVCGLLRIWRDPHTFQYSVEQLLHKNDEHLNLL